MEMLRCHMVLSSNGACEVPPVFFFVCFLNQLALPNTSYCSTSIKGTWNNNLLTLYELRVVHIVFKC